MFIFLLAPTTPPQPTSLQELLQEKDERITLLLRRIDALMENEQLCNENNGLKNDFSHVAELLEQPEPSDQAIKFLSSFRSYCVAFERKIRPPRVSQVFTSFSIDPERPDIIFT